MQEIPASKLTLSFFLLRNEFPVVVKNGFQRRLPLFPTKVMVFFFLIFGKNQMDIRSVRLKQKHISIFKGSQKEILAVPTIFPDPFD
jgi:hypothetical protein